ncbi:hypothetical protein EN852_034005 [Mesorhizobium sp. M2E.F.Ca.ET.209.01.1.1]|nr:hypothetical protein EN852_034005 [Mesorhizobium sp. M2E.F.Ca.ET.209.01.1.1]
MGGDWQLWRCRPFFNDGDWRKPARRLISPLVGEMSGRTEGGAVPPALRTGFRSTLWTTPLPRECSTEIVA